MLPTETRAELNDFTAPLRTEPALTRTIDLGVREIASRVKLINRDKAAVILALQNINSTD
jgi:lysyl aminopeptidase / alanine aminopeptidase